LPVIISGLDCQPYAGLAHGGVLAQRRRRWRGCRSGGQREKPLIVLTRSTPSYTRAGARKIIGRKALG